ncbi:MAG: formate dehydrogenase accessory sulfurtransferase FdhD [Thermodesulfobacteriota bacterium]|nr:formate dehydrogenase accessory sulfurtransferase FdhD [Thermodesulfobacteriota bacterium]
MKRDVKKFYIFKVNGKDTKRIEDTVVREFPLTILLNNHEIMTLICTPSNLDYLAAGFLFSEGLIKKKSQIKNIIIDLENSSARVETWEDNQMEGGIAPKRFITSSGGKITSLLSDINVQKKREIESQIEISADEIFSLMDKFVLSSQIFKNTGGVHSAALCDKRNLLLFSEDIGRHNAIDKVFGECILKGVQTDELIIITSGRVSSEILLKVAKRNVPLIISKSAPTDMGIQLSQELGITLVGFVRGRRMNVYTHGWRVIKGEPFPEEDNPPIEHLPGD